MLIERQSGQSGSPGWVGATLFGMNSRMGMGITMHAAWKRCVAARHSAMSSALCSSSSALSLSEMRRWGALDVCDIGLASRVCVLGVEYLRRAPCTSRRLRRPCDCRSSVPATTRLQGHRARGPRSSHFPSGQAAGALAADSGRLDARLGKPCCFCSSVVLDMPLRRRLARRAGGWRERSHRKQSMDSVQCSLMPTNRKRVSSVCSAICTRADSAA